MAKVRGEEVAKVVVKYIKSLEVYQGSFSQWSSSSSGSDHSPPSPEAIMTKLSRF
jgi:hypothetical protein